MSWTTAVVDLRKLLSDGPTDKLRYRKRVMGIQDGANKVFKTFEFRRVTNLVTATAPYGVYVNDVLVSVSADDLSVTGEFTLATAPTNGDTVRATYFLQWFVDAELEEFLISAAQWIGFADNYQAIPDGLQPSAKEYAASQAFQKLVLRWSENMAETYQLFDAPDERRFDPVQAYMNISKAKYELAVKLRDDVYKNRKGQALAPITGVLAGTVKNVAPNR